MPLTPEQIAQMDAALGVGQRTSLTPEMMAEMDAVVSENMAEPSKSGGAGKAFAYGFNRLIPFGNEISSQLAATAVAPFVPETRQELLEQAREHTEQTMQEHPWASGAGTVAGIVATLPAASARALMGAASTTGVRGAINAIPKGIAAVDRFVRGGKVAKDAGSLAKAGSLALRSAKGAAVAAPSAGLYAAGEARPGERGEAFVSGAGVGAGVGGALPVAGAALGAASGGIKNVYKGITARSVGVLEEALNAIKQGSRRLYSKAEQSGVSVLPESAQELANKLSGVIKEKDIASQRLYSGTLGAIKDLMDDVDAGNTGLMTLDRHRQILGNISKDITNPNKAQEAEAAGRAIDVIDDFVDSLSPEKLASGTPEAVDALKLARAEWAKSKRFEKISDIIVNAKGDANKLKRDLSNFRSKPKNTLGWSKAELEALDFAADQTTGEGVIKMLGKFGFDLGSGRSVGNTALPALGSAAGFGLASGAIGPAVGVMGVGTAARAGQKMLARGKAEELLKVIEQGGNVSMDMVNALPLSEKNKLLSRFMAMAPSKAVLLRNDEARTKK